MTRRVSSIVVLALLAGAVYGPSEAHAQFYWHRDSQRMYSSVSPAAVEVWAGPMYDEQYQYIPSGWVTGDMAESTALANKSVSVEVNPEEGIPASGSAEARAYSAGIAVLCPNNEPVMQWSFIHEQDISATVEGDAGAWMWSWQGSFVDAQAVLSHNDPPGGTTGRLRLNYIWGLTDPQPGWERHATVLVTFGNAWLVAFAEHPYPVPAAYGWDGYGNYFEKWGACPAVNSDGTFVIELSEFTGPLVVGNRARIWTIVNDDQLEDEPTWSLIARGPASDSYYGASLFQNTLEIHADNP